MIFTEIIFALLLAFIFTLIFARSCCTTPRTVSKTTLAGFFLILFMVVWAGSLWLTPFGPVVYGIYFLPALILGLIFMLLIAGLYYPSNPRNIEEAVEAVETQRAVEITFNVFFWTLILILTIAIIGAYV